VKNEAEKIELQDGVEAHGEFVEEGLEIVLLRNCLADFQQGLELPAGRIEGRRRTRCSGRILRFRHKTRIASGLAGSQPREGHAAGRAICVYSKRIGRGCVGEPREIFGVRKLSEKIGAVLWLVLLFVLPVFGLGGCTQGPQPQTGNSEEARRSAAASNSARAAERYDLSDDEKRGGHTLARHVARTDDELRERLHREGNISAASTWTDRETAEETIAEALRSERGRIESWMRRGYPRANLALHYEARRDIGRSLRQGETEAVRCRDTVIVLRADGPDGFYVLTAYPEARE